MSRTDESGLGPVSLRISVTDRCQLRCVYCMPTEGVPLCTHEDILRFEEMARFARVLKRTFGLAKVHLTGGEPLIRPGVADLVTMLADEGVEDLAMTTNGLTLAQLAPRLKRAGLHRINVSLESTHPDTYAKLTGGGNVADVMAGIDAAIDAELAPVKLNTVVLRGDNDGHVVELARWALDHGCEIRFLELMPIGPAKSLGLAPFVPSDETQRRLAESFTLEPLPYVAGLSSRYVRATDPTGRDGRIGFISPRSQPFCAGCNRLRLTSTGQLIACLATGRGTGIRDLLRAPGEQAERGLAELVTAELRGKPNVPGFDNDRPMATVGG